MAGGIPTNSRWLVGGGILLILALSATLALAVSGRRTVDASPRAQQRFQAAATTHLADTIWAPSVPDVAAGPPVAEP